MKKSIVFFIISMFFIIGCEKAKEVDKKRTISGKAAIGAYIEEGAAVEIRPYSSDGSVTTLLTGVVKENGFYEIVIPEDIPVEDQVIVEEPSIEGMSKAEGNVIETGFIVRIYSAELGNWVYSYAPNDTEDVVANSNPFTDIMIRQFYSGGNNMYPHSLSVNDKNIDWIFYRGYFDDGYAINVPNKDNINKIMLMMSKILAGSYGMIITQNALVDTWEVDKGLDALLDRVRYPRLNEFLNWEFKWLFEDLGAGFTNGRAIQEQIDMPVLVEIWTPYGNTGNVTCKIKGVTYLMEKQADSEPNNNHFKIITPNIGQIVEPYSTYIQIDDYNFGSGFNLSINCN
jgi:hypothetical protein